MAFHQGKFSFGPRGRCRHIEDGRPITDLTLVVRRHEYRQMVVSDNGKMREVPEALWRSTPKFRLAVWKGAVDAPKFSAQMLSVEGPIPISKIQQIRPRQILVRAGYIDFTGYDGTPDVTTKVSKIEEVEQIAKWRLERVHLLVPTKIAEDMTNTLAEYIFQWQKKERAISCIWVKTENAKELYKTLLDDAEITTVDDKHTKAFFTRCDGRHLFSFLDENNFVLRGRWATTGFFTKHTMQKGSRGLEEYAPHF